MELKAIEALETAINDHVVRPEWIRVGTELWKALNIEKRIEWGEVLAGKDGNTLIDTPIFDGDIYLVVDTAIDEWGYEMHKGN